MKSKDAGTHSAIANTHLPMDSRQTLGLDVVPSAADPKGVATVVNAPLSPGLRELERELRRKEKALAEMTKDRDFWRGRALGSDDKEAHG